MVCTPLVLMGWVGGPFYWRFYVISWFVFWWPSSRICFFPRMHCLISFFPRSQTSSYVKIFFLGFPQCIRLMIFLCIMGQCFSVTLGVDSVIHIISPWKENLVHLMTYRQWHWLYLFWNFIYLLHSIGCFVLVYFRIILGDLSFGIAFISFVLLPSSDFFYYCLSGTILISSFSWVCNIRLHLIKQLFSVILSVPVQSSSLEHHLIFSYVLFVGFRVWEWKFCWPDHPMWCYNQHGLL